MSAQFRSWTTARERELEAKLKELKANLTPCPPQEWELRKAEREELQALRLRVQNLEAQIDRMVDAAVELQIQQEERAPYVYPGRGRPKGVKESKPRRRRAS